MNRLRSWGRISEKNKNSPIDNMPNVRFSESAIDAINEYSRKYREYYEDLYSDTGIWWEDQIIDNYRNESYTRRAEIFDTIDTKLKQDIVFGRKPWDTLLLSWRSKTLLIVWEDIWDDRIVMKILIV
jgi:hypothetical protein